MHWDSLKGRFFLGATVIDIGFWPNTGTFILPELQWCPVSIACGSSGWQSAPNQPSAIYCGRPFIRLMRALMQKSAVNAVWESHLFTIASQIAMKHRPTMWWIKYQRNIRFAHHPSTIPMLLKYPTNGHRFYLEHKIFHRTLHNMRPRKEGTTAEPSH